MDMIGTYIFKQNGKEIYRSKNVITTYGKKYILEYLVRPSKDWSRSFAIGAMPTAATELDKELAFETYRFEVTGKSYQFGSPSIITIKGTMPESMQANIYEIGLYPQIIASSAYDRNNTMLADFSSIDQWDILSGSITINQFSPQSELSPRFGFYSITLNDQGEQETRYKNSSLNISTQGYGVMDSIKVLCRDVNTTDPDPAGNFYIVLTDSDGNSCNVYFTAQDQLGYQVLSAPIPTEFTNLFNISSVELVASPTTTITIDSIKVSTIAELSDEYYIASRSVLDIPIPKAYGVPLDIEYQVQLG